MKINIEELSKLRGIDFIIIDDKIYELNSIDINFLRFFVEDEYTEKLNNFWNNNCRKE